MSFKLTEHKTKESFESMKKKIIELYQKLDSPLPPRYGEIMPEFSYFTRELWK